MQNRVERRPTSETVQARLAGEALATTVRLMQVRNPEIARGARHTTDMISMAAQALDVQSKINEGQAPVEIDPNLQAARAVVTYLAHTFGLRTEVATQPER